MKKKRKQEEIVVKDNLEKQNLLHRMTIKELIAPSGIDVSNLNNLEIM